MSQLLNQFNNDAFLKDEVINYIHKFIDDEAIKRVYANENVGSVADARKLIDLAFENLDYLYGKRTRTKKPINKAK